MELKKNKQVLVVEDEDSYRRILVEKLSKEGFDTESAKDGKDGLDKAKSKHPDLILLDLEMPEVNGMEMVKILRSDDWGKTAKIVILTNLNDTNKIKEATDNGVYEFIVKADIEIDDLIHKIKTILG